ncbi:MAG TPA: glycosyltransferase [Dehalococcoidia bacterium]|nr:glycosyltransferase [Dehalococcoidia bacterium]
MPSTARLDQEERRLRVLVLASTFPRWPGDTEPPFVFNLSRALAERFDVTVLAPHAPGARKHETMDGVAVERFGYFWPESAQRLAYGGMLPNLKRNRWLWGQVPLFLAAQLLAANRLVRQKQIDVVHAHWVVPQGIVAALLGLMTRRPVVVTAHGGDIYGVRGSAQDALKRWVLRHCARVTAVSHDLGGAIEKLGSTQKTDVISMGIDTTRFRPSRRDKRLRAELAPDGPLLLFVGRLAEKKGVRYLIDALPAVLEQHRTARLAIVGDGALRDDLEARVRELGLEAHVVFTGAKRPEQLPAYFATADVFIGPSIVAEGGDTESFGLVFAEAMASGCAVVGSDVGGVRELVRNGETGVLVSPRDTVALAEAVSKLIGDPGLRARLARNGRLRVRRLFDQGSIADRYAAVLQEVATPSNDNCEPATQRLKVA